MKIEKIQYALICIILLCCTFTVSAQNEATSSKVIVGKSYNEASDTLKIMNTSGNVYMLPRSVVNTSIVVDRQTNAIELELPNKEIVKHGFDQDVVVINIDGVTILTTTSTSALAKNKKGSSSDVTSSAKAASSSDSKLYEYTASFGLGFLLYNDPVTIVSTKLRGTREIKPNLRVGLALSSDIYSFPAGVGLNYSSTARSLYMMTTMVGCDMILWPNKGSELIPDRLTVDLGCGFGLGSSGYSGFAFNPGLMWHILEYANDAKLCLSFEYKFQGFGHGSFGNDVILGVGYKF